MEKISKLLFVLLFGILFVPIILSIFKMDVLWKSLEGSFELAPKPSFNYEAWFEGTYQDSFNKYTNDKLYGRDFLVRSYNQYRYSLFGIINANGTIKGKDNVLFQDFYIDALKGIDKVDSTVVNKDVLEFKALQSALKKINKSLILVIAPGKASIYPEYLPDNVKISKNTINNYSLYTKALNKNNVSFIDLKQFLIAKKSEVKYPLFPRNGTHWSGYAVTLVMDTLSKFIEKESGVDLINFKSEKGVFTDNELRFTDDDIGKATNLLFPPENWPLYYPSIVFENNSKKKKPGVLSIGDSFNQSFWGFYPYFSELFNEKSRYWYYNKVIGWPDSLQSKYIEVHNLSLYDEIMQRDIIMIVTTEQNLKTFGFGFVHEALPMLAKNYSDFLKERDKVILRIKSDPHWLAVIEQMAKEKGVSLDIMLKSNAEWVIANTK
jgi:hypothetical protein